METARASTRIHPLMAGAAASLMLLSLIGFATSQVGGGNGRALATIASAVGSNNVGSNVVKQYR
jgi:outer membrane lipoprotein SlyB